MNKQAKGKVGEAEEASSAGEGTVVVSKSSPYRPYRLLRANKNWPIIGGAATLLILIVVAVVVLWPNDQNKDHMTYAQRYLSQTKNETRPSDKGGQITYYSNLGYAYYEAGDYQKALDAYLKADSLITVRDPNKDRNRSVNTALALSYDKLGNKDKAREYYQREIDRLQNSNNEGIIKHLKELKAQV